METNILIVDDEPEIADLVELYLQNEGYNVYKFYTAAAALDCIAHTKLDLAILDVMLPETDGFAICQAIRTQYNYPVIMLTAKGEEVDKITGLTLGADDYVTKPFRPLELVARVKAQLRRYQKYNPAEAPTSEAQEDMLTIGGLTLNRTTHSSALDEAELALTPTEFAILWHLAANRGRVISAEELFQTIWGEKYYTNSNNTVMVHIRHLREKLHDTGETPRYIKTVWGVGYKIEN